MIKIYDNSRYKYRSWSNIKFIANKKVKQICFTFLLIYINFIN